MACVISGLFLSISETKRVDTEAGTPTNQAGGDIFLNAMV